MKLIQWTVAVATLMTSLSVFAETKWYYSRTESSQAGCAAYLDTWYYPGSYKKVFVNEWQYWTNGHCRLYYERLVKVVPDGYKVYSFNRTVNTQDGCFNLTNTWIRRSCTQDIKPHLATYYSNSNRCELHYYKHTSRVRTYRCTTVRSREL